MKLFKILLTISLVLTLSGAAVQCIKLDEATTICTNDETNEETIVTTYD